MRKRYKIDWDKVETLEDALLILKAMDIEFFAPPVKIEGMEHLLKEVNYEG